jgi:hypothetical protein
MGPIPPLPATWSEQKPYVGRVNQIGTENLIKEIFADQPHTSFHFVLGAIIEKLIEENRVLAFEDDATIPQLAWAGRNIMELRVLTRYICQSRGNLKRFEADVLAVGATTLQALIRLHNDLAREVGSAPASSKEHRSHVELQAARERAGLGSESPLMNPACAKRVGMEKELLVFSGVTSRLVHPTALSVLKTFDLEVYRDVLVPHGLILASKVILDAREHIQRHGYKPPK